LLLIAAKNDKIQMIKKQFAMMDSSPKDNIYVENMAKKRAAKLVYDSILIRQSFLLLPMILSLTALIIKH
jgi:hypothetical protein